MRVAKQNDLQYDTILSRVADGETIRYGILFGNDTIIFIKSGAGSRSLKGKYLKMAHKAHERMGATVICASNPDCKHGDIDAAIIETVAEKAGFSTYKLYFAGHSDGGYKVFLLAAQFPQTVKVLGINASPITLAGFKEKLQAISHIPTILVYGSKDEMYSQLPSLQTLLSDHLTIRILDGIDHRFKGNTEEFIALVDLL